jgi:hypothetical protein
MRRDVGSYQDCSLDEVAGIYDFHKVNAGVSHERLFKEIQVVEVVPLAGALPATMLMCGFLPHQIANARPMPDLLTSRLACNRYPKDCISVMYGESCSERYWLEQTRTLERRRKQPVVNTPRKARTGQYQSVTPVDSTLYINQYEVVEEGQCFCQRTGTDGATKPRMKLRPC